MEVTTSRKRSIGKIDRVRKVERPRCLTPHLRFYFPFSLPCTGAMHGCSQLDAPITIDRIHRWPAETRTAPFLDLWVFLEGEYHSCSIHVLSVCCEIIERYAGRRFWARGGVYLLTLTLHVAHACIHMLHNRGSDSFTCDCSDFSFSFSMAHCKHADRSDAYVENETLAMRSQQTDQKRSDALHCLVCQCAPSA